jgi:uncharacterized protein (DUF1697 family)
VGRSVAYVALLRGVNVGGRNRLAMADLREVIESLGHRQVKTYIQSGNAIFSTGEDDSRQDASVLAVGIRDRIAERLDLDVDVMVRDRDDLEAILAGVPFPDVDPKRLLIAFLSDAPSPEATRALESIEAGPEAARVVGRVAYLNLPNGVGRSVLAPQVERRLKVRATARNLATVRTLLAMTDSSAD